MATESAAQLLEKIRSHLLELAGSNPTTPSATPLSTLDEIIANSETGPFRCQKCRASLLRGPNSQICAACGTEREEVASSFRISFASTLAYQLLMTSFQPQDSEVATGKSTPHIEAASLQTQQTEPMDGLIACDILNLVLKWPEDEARSKEQASVTQTANANAPRGMEFDLEDFFVQSKSHNVAGPSKEVFTSTQHREDVKWHAPADSMPQVSLSKSNIDLFSAQQGRQTQTHARDVPFGDFKSANSILDNSESKNQEVFTSTDLIEDVKCNAPGDSMAQVSLSESNIDLFCAQPGRQAQTHNRDDIFGDFKSGNSTLYKSDSKNQEVFASTHHIEDVKYHAPADSMPQVNVNENNIDLFGSQAGRQQIQTHTRDDDPFGDFESANSTLDNFESKNLDTPAVLFNDYSNLMEETKGLDWTVTSHSTFHGQDLFADTGNGMEHVTPMQGIWIQGDPWSTMITEENYIGSSKNLKESSDLQSDWPGKNILTDSQDPFAGSVWQQGDISQHNESTTEKSISRTTGESGGAEHDVLFASDLASQVLELDKETTRTNSILTEIDIFNRVESREVNHQAKPNSVSPEMEDIMAAMPKEYSNNDSEHVVESLLSEMHDLSFMLADHLVIPDRNRKHSICL